MEKFSTTFFSLASVLISMQCLIALGGGATNYTTSDESVLLAFKSHLTYDPNHILAANWTTNTSFCHWLGVSCCCRGQNRVTSLNLSNMGLQGTIPPQIGNLSFLTNFNISFNHFNGHLPAELGQLRRLKEFDLYGNDFSGEIPTSIFNVSAIQWINVANNSLSGSLSDYMCSHLPKLRVLWLSYNEFVGDVPSKWGECRELQYLSFFGNKFTGFIPRSIGNLTMLKKLYLGQNNLQGELPLEMENLRSLEILGLRSANLTSSIPSSLFNISSLKELYLLENQLFGSLPMDICSSDVHGLEFLALQHNQLTGSIPRYVGNCTSLRVLDLSDNKLSEYGQEGLVSTKCDVYSFGIMMMEVFTRKKPTDEMFTSDLSLSRWVSEALVKGVTQAIDSRLIRKDEEHFFAKVSCVSSIFELALNCTAESPENRINIKHALALLQKIRLKFLAKLQ
ncbi:hypothetical protein Vadar_019390 [Vaccinium darrowii]|uniref:Uncharacterized protein n=1 Tax=Vaccinium darrowii TaxID=229202 RepID=A0ACB7Y046_9ERIC|nr:hypothetical protein Vadar_019390 [Vaccinium darrowii]